MSGEFDKELPDFHSPEFNRVDDLNDWSGNYLSFEPLGDTVTADMRHQMERTRCDTAAVDAPVGRAVVSSGAATSDGAKIAETVTPLTIVSNGRTLIVATDSERANACAEALR